MVALVPEILRCRQRRSHEHQWRWLMFWLHLGFVPYRDNRLNTKWQHLLVRQDGSTAHVDASRFGAPVQQRSDSDFRFSAGLACFSKFRDNSRICLLPHACIWRYGCYNQWLEKSIKTWSVLLQLNCKAYNATLGPAKRWIFKRATAKYLFGRARCGVQSNSVAINHLFTCMFEINCNIHPYDRLNLTNAPIGPIRMGHKITKAEIKQMRISFGFVQEEHSKDLSLSCHDWVEAGKPIRRKKPNKYRVQFRLSKGKAGKRVITNHIFVINFLIMFFCG